VATVTPPAEEPVEEAPAEVLAVEELEPAAVDEPVETPQEAPVEEPQAAPVEKAPPAPASRSQLYWTALISSLLTLILAVVLSLGILSTMNNNNLQYASPAQVNELAARAGSLEAAVETLSGDLASMRKRVDNLEALSGRVTAIEGGLADINTELQAVSGQVEEVSTQVGELSGQMEQVMAQSERFQTFFNGLRELMNQVFVPEEAGK